MHVLLKRFSVIAGFSILVVVLLVAMGATRHQFGILIDNESWVAHTRQVLFQISETLSLLEDAETGQRGFLLTGEAKYLAPYNLARTRVDAQIETLAHLTADNPRQQASIAELRALAHQKLDELQQTISLFQQGHQAEAKEVVLSDRGLNLMNQIRQLASRMKAEELTLEELRTARYDRSIRFTIGSIYATALVAILGLILLAHTIIRASAAREQYLRDTQGREEWFRVTLTSIGDAVIATDRDGKVTFFNPVAEGLLGKTLAAAKGLPIREVFPIFNEVTGAEVENPVAKVIEKGLVVGLANHTVLRHTNGNLIPIEDSAAPIFDDQHRLIGVVLVFRDVTGERKSQELLRKSEKLSAAARLSATVAHEINNPLEAVCNLIYLAKLMPGAPVEIIEKLALAEQELARVAHITRQTLGFYRESNLPQALEAAPMIESVIALYSNKLQAKNITVHFDFEACPPVIGVPGELRQAISNLVSNAVDAAPPGGNIKLSLQCILENDGKQVQMVIEDDGPGIPRENITRVFEPFFTTKKDVGTGLGLYVTRQILERHGGSVALRANSNENGVAGACFILRLPSTPEPPLSEPFALPV